MYEDRTQNCDPEIHRESLIHNTPFPLSHHLYIAIYRQWRGYKHN